jgi:hypothetical protein
VERNKRALTIGPVINCCFNNGAKVAKIKKRAKRPALAKTFIWIELKTIDFTFVIIFF